MVNEKVKGKWLVEIDNRKTYLIVLTTKKLENIYVYIHDDFTLQNALTEYSERTDLLDFNIFRKCDVDFEAKK